MFFQGGWTRTLSVKCLQNGQGQTLKLYSGGGAEILNNKKFTTYNLYKIDSLLNYKKTVFWKTEIAFVYNWTLCTSNSYSIFLCDEIFLFKYFFMNLGFSILFSVTHNPF